MFFILSDMTSKNRWNGAAAQQQELLVVVKTKEQENKLVT